MAFEVKNKKLKEKSSEEKIYWKNLPSNAEISVKGQKGSQSYYYGNKLIYWNGEDSYFAQQYLNEKYNPYKNDKKQFNSLKSFYDEIHKRKYRNIQGLKAEISSKSYYEMLEALPPMKWTQGKNESHFYMSEFLTGDLTTKFTKKEVNGKTKYYAEVVDFRKESGQNEYYKERYGVDKKEIIENIKKEEMF